MSQLPGHNRGLFDSLQSEVAPEASPLLDFLVKHTKTVILVFLLIILAIGGYWIYSYNVHKASLEEQKGLGSLLIIQDPAKRLTSLEEYLKTAPDNLRNQVLLAIAQSAVEANNDEKLLATWNALSEQAGQGKKGEQGDSLGRLSSIGTASVLAEQGKYKEAIAVYDRLLPDSFGTGRMLINRTILNYAELAGDTPRAIKACEDLLAENTAVPAGNLPAESASVLDAERMLLMQKLAMLRLQAE